MLDVLNKHLVPVLGGINRYCKFYILSTNFIVTHVSVPGAQHACVFGSKDLFRTFITTYLVHYIIRTMYYFLKD